MPWFHILPICYENVTNVRDSLLQRRYNFTMLTHTKKAERQPEAEYKASPGRVFWITGLSGAGKTTLGRELWSRLRAAGRPVTFLDGDALRAVIAEDLGHSADDRRRSAMRNARLCRLLAEQGADVVCATISLFHEVQRWNRENIPGYREIYLRVPIDELRRRDSKGIYAGAQRGDARDVVGLDVPAEAPEAPDLVLDNYGALDVATAVDRILAVCDQRDEWRACGAAGAPRRLQNEGGISGSAGAAAAQWARPAPGPILGWRLALGRRWRARCRRRCALGFRSGHRAEQCTGRGRRRELPGREVRFRTRCRRQSQQWHRQSTG